MSSQSIHDIQIYVAFLKARVKQADDDYCSKIVRVLNYLKGGIGLNLKLCVDVFSIDKWWVVVSYALHK